MSRVLDRAISIADLSGYTVLTEAHGDLHAAETVARYVEPRPGCRAGRARRRRSARRRAERGPGDRVGDGPPRRRRGRACLPHSPCGAPLGIARRARRPSVRRRPEPRVEDCRARRGGQILCSLSLREAAGDLAGVHFEPRGTARFKNVSDAVELFALVDPTEPRHDAVTDPVCRMRITPDSAPARLPFRGETYFFCSFECARRFAADPESHVPSA